MMSVKSGLSLLAAIPLASCYNPLTNNNVALKYQFLPITSEKVWSTYIRGENASCGDVYNAYVEAWKAKDWHAAADGAYSTSDCILNNAQEMLQKTGDSATVLLGLTPILFSTLGPSITELGLISTQKPLLALMFSMGTVAVYPSRVLSSYDDKASEVLSRITSLDMAFGLWLKKRRSLALCILIGIVEYIIAAVAIFNVIYTSWQLGTATIFVADSPASFYPMIWTFSPVLVHLCASGALHANIVARVFGKVRRRRDDVEQSLPLNSISEPKTGHSKASNTDQVSSDNFENSGNKQMLMVEAEEVESKLVPKSGNRFLNWVTLQFVPSVAHPPIPQHVTKPSNPQILLHNLATCLGFAQILYGTIVFSSLLYVAIADAAVILLRYFASIVACRLLIAFELGGMRSEMAHEEEKQD